MNTKILTTVTSISLSSIVLICLIIIKSHEQRIELQEQRINEIIQYYELPSDSIYEEISDSI